MSKRIYVIVNGILVERKPFTGFKPIIGIDWGLGDSKTVFSCPFCNKTVVVTNKIRVEK